MADYTRMYEPGAPITMVAGRTIRGGRLLELSADWEVEESSAGSLLTVGVAAHDADSDDNIAVFPRGAGVHTAITTTSIGFGDMLKAAADGKVAKWVSPTDAAVPQLGMCIAGGNSTDTITYLLF